MKASLPHKRRLVLIAIGALLEMTAHAGCVHVDTTVTQSSKIVDQMSEVATLGDWHDEVKVEGRPTSPSEALLSGRVSAFRDCSRVTVTTSDDTSVYERHPASVGMLWAEAALGAAGAGVLTWGLVEHAHGEPFTRSEPDSDSSKFTDTGTKVFLGGVASVFLLGAVVTVMRSIDTQTTERVEHRSTKSDACERGPIPAATIGVKADGGMVAESRTDAEGHFEMPIALARLKVLGRPSLLVNGRELDPPEALIELQQAAKGTAPTVTASQETRAPPKTLLLFGVPLKNADRSNLEAAIEHAGGHKLAGERSKNISQFDVAALDLPGMQSIKLLFDGQFRFVQAKYKGALAKDRLPELLATLTERYGAPRTTFISASKAYAWSFDDGLEVTYAFDETARTPLVPFTLSYVDVASEAALREIVKRASGAR